MRRSIAYQLVFIQNVTTRTLFNVSSSDLYSFQLERVQVLSPDNVIIEMQTYPLSFRLRRFPIQCEETAFVTEYEFSVSYAHSTRVGQSEA